MGTSHEGGDGGRGGGGASAAAADDDDDDVDDVGAEAPASAEEAPPPPQPLDKADRAQLLYRGAGLAPMVRCSTTPLRTLALHYGAHFCYTEELIDKSVIECRRVERTLTSSHHIRVVDYEKDLSTMNDKVRRKHDGLPPVLLRIDPNLEANQLICQLGTGDPQLALQAAQVVHNDVAAFDVNMGCPKKFSTGGGMGSALLKHPQRASDIIRTLDAHLPIHPVSAKIRLLATPLATIEFGSALIHSGASALAIHGRRVGDPDTTDADWTSLRHVASVLAQKFPRVPIAINGDFYTRCEFEQFMMETSASAVLLARPALHNPSLFVEPPPTSRSASASYGYDSPLLLDKTGVVQEYVRNAARYEMHWKNAKYVVCEMLNVRRTPASRVPSLLAAVTNTQQDNTWPRPTIGQTCVCKSMEALCELWRVSPVLNSNVPVRGEANGCDRTAIQGSTIDDDGEEEGDDKRCPRPQPQHHPAGDHNYSDSYILNHVQEAPLTVIGTPLPSENDCDATATYTGADHAHPSKKARAGT